MSELTARNLRSRGAAIAAVANRTAAHGEELAARRRVARPSGSTRIPALLATADVVVTSTSAPGFVLDRDELAAARSGPPRPPDPLRRPRRPARRRSRRSRTIDGCFVYDIDDLEAVVEASLAGRRVEAVRAEQIVAAEAERFREWQASLAVVPAIASLRARAEEIRSGELAKAEGRLERLPESERRLVESVTSQIVAKLLHLPTVRMKEAAAGADGVIYADVVRHLFGLGEEEQSVTRPVTHRAAAARFRLRPRSSGSAPAAGCCAASRAPRRLAAACCFASAPAAVGSRSPRPSAPRRRLRRPGVEIALVPITTAGDRDRTSPFGEIGCRGCLRQGARGGAARGPDRRRRPLREGHDLDPTSTGSWSAPTPPREDPRDALCGARRDPRRDADRHGLGAAPRPAARARADVCRSSRCAATSTRGCASGRARDSTPSCSPPAVSTGWASQPRSASGSIPGVMLPEAGQGALALQVRAGEEELVAGADDARDAAAASRPSGACVALVGGGCLAPVAAHHDGVPLTALDRRRRRCWIERRCGRRSRCARRRARSRSPRSRRR